MYHWYSLVVKLSKQPLIETFTCTSGCHIERITVEKNNAISRQFI